VEAVRVRGIELAIRDEGEGVPFIWGHGLICSMAQDDDAGIFPFARMPEGIRLVRYDARGHGRSQATLDPAAYRWPELAGDLLALADTLSIDVTVLGGISMGCATSLHAAVQAPDRVKGLVLVAPPTAWRTRPRQARIYRFSAGLVGALGLGPFRALGSLSRLGQKDSALDAMQRSVMDHLRRSDARAVQTALRGAALSDLPDEESVAKLGMPALILAWSGDPTHPVSTAKRLAELLPDAELHVAKKSGDIAGWAERIRSFLSARRPSAAPAT
jgi:pimeloyl-ACP methyl ester carboxylesterase